MSQAELAARLSTSTRKVARSTVGHYANALRSPIYKMRKRLLEVFGIPLDWWDESPSNDVDTPAPPAANDAPAVVADRQRAA
jgi:transcriptional regulator with XRE-family HTH domain